MKNLLQVFSFTIYFSRVFGLAPYQQTKSIFKKSKFWNCYSYLAFITNACLQLYNYRRFVVDSNFKPTIGNISWSFASVTFRLNSIISVIPILHNVRVLEKLSCSIDENFFKNINIKVDKKNIARIQFVMSSINRISFAIAITLPTLQTYCYFKSWNLTITDEIITSLAMISRTCVTIAIFGQFYTYVSLCRFCIELVNSNIRSKNFDISKKKLIINYSRNHLIFIKSLKVLDLELKGFIQRINNIFGIFICLLATGVIAETLHELAYNLILYEIFSCQSGLSFYWIGYSWLLLTGVLLCLVSLEQSVSFIFSVLFI